MYLYTCDGFRQQINQISFLKKLTAHIKNGEKCNSFVRPNPLFSE